MSLRPPVSSDSQLDCEVAPGAWCPVRTASGLGNPLPAPATRTDVPNGGLGWMGNWAFAGDSRGRVVHFTVL